MKKRKKKKFNLKGYIFGSLRKIWRWHPERKQILEIARVIDSEHKDWFVCQQCNNLYPRKQVHVDHIKPVIDPSKGFVSWDEYIKRLFVTHKKLQVLCTDCHQQKSNLENLKRRK